jgi:hypothetical protein
MGAPKFAEQLNSAMLIHEKNNKLIVHLLDLKIWGSKGAALI